MTCTELQTRTYGTSGQSTTTGQVWSFVFKTRTHKILAMLHHVVAINFVKSPTLQFLMEFIEISIYINNTKYIQYECVSHDEPNHMC